MNDSNLNNNKEDINSYVNSNDMINYLSFLNFKNKYIFRISEIIHLDELFAGDNHTAIILLNDQDPSGIGHFVVLRHDDHYKYTYFDCLGKKPPEEIVNLFTNLPGKIRLEYLSKALMSKTNNICGKYCISFILAGNIDIKKYSLLLSGGNASPDSLINNLYRLNYNGNIV